MVPHTRVPIYIYIPIIPMTEEICTHHIQDRRLMSGMLGNQGILGPFDF